jgi:hypothetical protein
VQGRGGLLVPGGAVVGRAGHGTRTHSQAGGDAGGVAGGPGGQPQLGAGGQGKMTSFIEFRNKLNFLIVSLRVWGIERKS